MEYDYIYSLRCVYNFYFHVLRMKINLILVRKMHNFQKQSFKVWGMKDTWFFCLVILIKVTFLTKYHVVHLIKKDKQKKKSSKWSWFIQIGHTKWLRLNQINHVDLTFN